MQHSFWMPLIPCLALSGCSGHGGSASSAPATQITTVESQPFAFQAPQSVSVGDGPNDLALADFDGDGAVDLATANLASGDVTIALNASMQGSSASFFGATSAVAVMESSASLAAADFDEDADADLVVLDRAKERARFLRNATAPGGSPSFALAGNSLIASPTPWTVIAGDWNLDGHADVAVSSDGKLLVFGSRNLGMRSLDPHFQPGRVLPNLALDAAPAMGPLLSLDADGDGKPELASVSMVQNELLLFPNDGATAGAISFGAPLAYGVGIDPVDMDAGDLDGDGKPEIVVAHRTAPGVTILVNQSGAPAGIAFSPTTIDAVDTLPVSIALADADRDGRLDILLGDGQAQAILVRINQSSPGAIAFAGAWQALPLGSTPKKMRAVDWNGDGAMDLLTASQENDAVTAIVSKP